jgi:hypothetical protein
MLEIKVEPRPNAPQWWAWDGRDTWINLENPGGWAELRALPQTHWVIYRWPLVDWHAAAKWLGKRAKHTKQP